MNSVIVFPASNKHDVVTPTVLNLRNVLEANESEQGTIWIRYLDYDNDTGKPFIRRFRALMTAVQFASLCNKK